MFLDIPTAFDSVDRSTLCHSLENGVPEKCVYPRGVAPLHLSSGYDL